MRLPHIHQRFRPAVPRWIGTGLLLLCLILGSGCASKHFFYPTTDLVRQPDRAYEDVFFPSLDGTRLHAWFVPAKGVAKGTLVHFHGNAQNLTHHYIYVHWLPDAGYNVFTFDYRGFGKSQGTPDFGAVVEDGLAALAYLHGREDIDGDRLVVFGQSMGGAIAASVIGKYQPPGVKAVLLDSPLSSFRLIAKETLIKMDYCFPLYYMPYLLVPDDNSPIRHIDKISPRPLLIVHGGADQVVHPSHSRRLFKKAAEPKRLVVLPDIRHVDAFTYHLPKTKSLMLDFYENALDKPPPGQLEKIATPPY